MTYNRNFISIPFPVVNVVIKLMLAMTEHIDEDILENLIQDGELYGLISLNLKKKSFRAEPLRRK